MKVNTKALAILDFICAAFWLVTAIWKIIDKEFSVKIILDFVVVIVFFTNGLLAIKGKLPVEKDEHLDDYKENKEN